MARLTRLAVLLTLAFGTACQPYHLPGGGYDDGPQIGEHGISVPVPPPSLTAAPRQTVDVEGELRETDPEPGTEVFLRVYTLNGDYDGYITEAEPDGTFFFDDEVTLDLTDNCIEVYSEAPSAYGSRSMVSFFRATIAEDDQSILTRQFFSGCVN